MAKSYAVVVIVINQGGPAIEVIRGFKTKELAEAAAEILRDIRDVSWGYSIKVIQDS